MVEKCSAMHRRVHLHTQRRKFILGMLAGVLSPLGSVVLSRTAQAQSVTTSAFAAPTKMALALINAARTQIGVTLIYDGSYVQLHYPNGDVPIERGVCTDVIVRAYRQAFGYDLQQKVHEDMSRAFSAYPTIWGMRRPDRHIDHRRVPNLQTFFKRQGVQLPVSSNTSDYLPGDLVTMTVGRNLPHIVIVSDRYNQSASRPFVIHNIGAGTREEDVLMSFKITGHYRFFPSSAT